MVVRLSAQEPAGPFNFANAAFAELRDQQGQVLLRGEFGVVEDDDEDEVERTAVLTSTGVDADASGEVEVEVSSRVEFEQEIELTAISLSPGARLTFAIDAQDVATVVVDRRGRIELERHVRTGHLQ
jgi:hypothetical protein